MFQTKRDLLEELVVEILLRLPVKYIVQCKTLSKHYHSLIRSPAFIDRHLHLVATKTSHVEDRGLILFDNSLNESDAIPVSLFNIRTGCTMPIEGFPLIDDERKCVVRGPVNGVYCVVFVEHVGFIDNIILWNPTTREQHKLLPFSMSDVNYKGSFISNGLFGSMYFPRICGFGFDANTNDFKVLIACYRYRISDLFLYSLRSGKWSRINGSFSDDNPKWRIFDTRNSIYVCGACHWVSDALNYTSALLTFDMSKEVFGSLSFPSELAADCRSFARTVVADLRSSLALVYEQVTMDAQRSSLFDVWVMKEYGITDSWQILYRISLSMPLSGLGGFLGIVGELFFVREYEGCVVSYNLHSNDEKRYGIRVDTDSIECIVPYVETIVSFNSS